MIGWVPRHSNASYGVQVYRSTKWFNPEEEFNATGESRRDVLLQESSSTVKAIYTAGPCAIEHVVGEG